MKYKIKALKGDRKFEVIVNEAATEATVYVYDAIESDEWYAEMFGGVSSKKFIEQLNAITAPVINLRINSPGGDVFAARTMEVAIKNHPSKVVAYIDGLAASAASVLAMAADEVVIAQGGFIMIHNASTFTSGNANDFEDMAGKLRQVDLSIADTYEAKTKADKKQIKKWMDEETWFGAADSVEKGFADKIMDFSPKASLEWDLSNFANAPKPEQPNTSIDNDAIINIVENYLENKKVIDDKNYDQFDAERKRKFEASLLI